MTATPPFTLEGHELLDQIGSGNAGTVYRLRPSATPSATTLAVKIIPPAKVHAAVRREVSLHKTLNHPNIARLHRVVTARPTTPVSPGASTPFSLALVMDYAPAGDMFTEVASAISLPPRTLRRRLRDITAALAHLHDARIAHLDVKLENVVLTNTGASQLIDFGCAQRIEQQPSRATTLGGTLHYLPPELIKEPNTPPAATSDAWSLGVLVYTALAGCYPFNAACDDASDESNDLATRNRIVNGNAHPLPPHAEQATDLVRIINGLLQKDPTRRWTISQVQAELKRSESSIRIPMRARKVQERSCAHGRPHSPSSAAEADFAPCNCFKEQSLSDALHIVDSIQQARGRAHDEVRRYMLSMPMSYRTGDAGKERNRVSSRS